MVCAVGDLPVGNALPAPACLLRHQKRENIVEIECSYAAQMLSLGEASEFVSEAYAPGMGIKDARTEPVDEIRQRIVAPACERS